MDAAGQNGTFRRLPCIKAMSGGICEFVLRLHSLSESVHSYPIMIMIPTFDQRICQVLVKGGW